MELEKVYNPKETESKWYKFWEEKKYFESHVNPAKKPFTMVIPPPNITGILHMGHVLNNTIQDILARYKRMSGYETCWIPGTDHAGIATQNVVEKSLAKEKIFRRDLTREQFLEYVWKWKDQYGGTIIKQLRYLGSSCDWPRERFTLDEGLSDAVKEVFVRLYDKGLIYKGKYIVNWCPRCTTALSDDEVEHRDHEASLWHIKYPLKGTNEHIVVATTRPETMLGDTAVAVNPSDERYKHLIGKTLILPLAEREIPIVADAFVDPAFGTGMVKVTPAHDPNDFHIGKRNNLPQIIAFDVHGKMNENVPEIYRGLDRYECRKKVVEHLTEKDLLVKTDKHKNAVGHCYRCDTVIEPYLSDQWFVKMKPMAEKALEAVTSGKIQFTPERWVKVYQHWMENINDWCISRQLWWGHRLPVYYCNNCRQQAEAQISNLKSNPETAQKEKWIIVSKELPKKCPHCGSTALEQDPDVLDTWFSSWLWPFSTLGWPKENEDLKYYYPTDTLVTAADIIFFWVARMIMAGLEFKGEVPFKKVYFNSIVRDAQGRKMSKSLGNSPDPLDIINEYSADALRFTVAYLSPIGQDVLFAKEKCEIGRNFCNKIWNASRFILLNVDNNMQADIKSLDSSLAPMDKWILSEYNQAIKETTKYLDELNFTGAAHILHEFFWSKFCDWYVEFVKPRLQDEKQKEVVQYVFLYVLTNSLKLMHPIMPFITEELYQQTKGLLPEKSRDESIMISSWPVFNAVPGYESSVKEVEFVMEFIKAIRTVRVDMNVAPQKQVEIVINTADKEKFEIIQKYLPNMTLMCKVGKVSAGSVKPRFSAIIVAGGVEIFILLEGIIDFEKEKARLDKNCQKVIKDIEGLNNKLSDSRFLQHAPEKEVERLKAFKKENEDKLASIKKYIDVLQAE
ncbi:MAG: valine--tRNA ligase [Elusimicrobia bacterium RIFOXYA2_FULL_39_19]|nr:MAG: valine--tRNA ligase [Elusimicrobia bacterium RIFOXYA2_FULL_39_19]